VESLDKALASAQHKAEDLFADVVGTGLIRPGVLESELSEEIQALARTRFGVHRHWHKRVVRCGANTLLPYRADPPDQRLGEDDVVYLDFGPLFDEWEADFGRTYVLGADPRKHRLVQDIEEAFRRGKRLYESTPDLRAGDLYDFVNGLARQSGWEFGNDTAGHLIGHFPHETSPGQPGRLSIRHGNDLRLRAPDEAGNPRHWILEIHFVDRVRSFGGFFEELLTVDTSRYVESPPG
jgi:Xaa-Pro dipeptidase